MHHNLSQVQLAVWCPVGFHIFGPCKEHMGGKIFATDADM